MSTFTRKQRQAAGQKIFHLSRRNILAHAKGQWHKVFFYSCTILVLRLFYRIIGGRLKQQAPVQLKQFLFPELLENKLLIQLKVLLGLRLYVPFRLYKNSDIKTIKHKKITFPGSDNPDVSVVLPTYKNYNYTFNCLLCLCNIINTYQLNCEIIVVNDCSPDETAELLQNVSGIRVLTNKENFGFLRTVNAGAAIARGKYILLLNNDIQAGTDFITPLVSVFKEHADAGAAGGKLIYPTGLLQEAGAYIYADGSAENFGRLEHPDFWMYNYLKEVDYCTGALLMIPREYWIKAGGFDERYVPIYYEESDLCFQIRNQQQKKIYYTPSSVVIHFEGITSGTDTGTGLKKFQQINSQKFAEKWKNILKNYPQQTPGSIKRFFAEQNSEKRKRILLLYPGVPEFDKDSGSNRTSHIINILCKTADVYLYADGYYINYNTPYSKKLQERGCRIIYRHEASAEETFVFADILQKPFDVVFITAYHLAEKYFEQIHATKATVVFDSVDLHYLRYEREETLNNQPHTISAAMKEKELSYIKRSHITYVVSAVEKDLLTQMNTGNVHILSNIHVPVSGKGLSFEKRSGLLFIGGFNHRPNADAVKWLKEEIMPLVWEKNPDISVHIVGSNPSEEINKLNSERFIIHGFVKEVTPLFFESKLFICPLRYGAGVKGKIGQALEHHLPVVTTAVGSEGMSMQHGVHCWQADDATQFAEGILHLYENEEAWELLQRNSNEVLQGFSVEVATAELNRMLAYNQK
jgi:O-antigen biosynthesis protein